MALESVTHIGDLVVTNPTSSDPKQQGDDHIRNLKLAARNCFPGFTGAIVVGGSDTGVADAYVLTPATTLKSYIANTIVVAKLSNTNTAVAPSINISGLGARTIKAIDGGPIKAGDLVAGRYVAMVDDGTAYRLLSITKKDLDDLRAYAEQLAFSAALPLQPGGATSYYLDTTSGIASWKAVVPPQILRSARTANSALGVSDRGSLIDITSGTFTQTFAAAATLGNGWYCYLGNSGNGDITLDPNGAETIDGLATFVMYPGEARLVMCDGASLRSVVLNSFAKTFTATASWVKPPGYSHLAGELLSGGNGGYCQNPGSTAEGGGGGGCFPFVISMSSLGTSETITVGGGGAGSSSPGVPGALGGVSAIGSKITMTPSGNSSQGSGITSSTTTANADSVGFEATSSGGRKAIYAGGTSLATGTGGSSIFGGGAGGSVNSGGGISAPGASKFAGNGGAASTSANGAAGVAPSGGGGGCVSGFTGGAGARGEVRLRGII